jgi:hypothetical protein
MIVQELDAVPVVTVVDGEDTLVKEENSWKELKEETTSIEWQEVELNNREHEIHSGILANQKDLKLILNLIRKKKGTLLLSHTIKFTIL